ncbi:ATP-binding cassette sub-family C member 2-like, partial [Babylonia areolata]|uniref:ATP-binding cassette sub-family C member 2-like n=1 Tax=Babylonia areolata TaxID=304850 RepID=UPI003FD58860
MNSLVFKGFRYALTLSDIWDLPPQFKGRAVICKFSHAVEKHSRTIFTSVRTVKPAPETRRHSQVRVHSQSGQTKATISEKTPLLRKGSLQTTPSGGSGGGNGRDASANIRSKVQSRKSIPLFRCLAKTFYTELVFSCALRLTSDCLQFLNPVLLDSLISYMERKDEHRQWEGYLLVVGFFLVSFMVSICQNQNFYLANNMGMKIKTALVASVYRKV